MAICKAEYHPPTAVHSGWPVSLDAWFERTFALDRERRFDAALEAVDALAGALAPLMGEAAATPPPSTDADWDQQTTVLRRDPR